MRRHGRLEQERRELEEEWQESQPGFDMFVRMFCHLTLWIKDLFWPNYIVEWQTNRFKKIQSETVQAAANWLAC